MRGLPSWTALPICTKGASIVPPVAPPFSDTKVPHSGPTVAPAIGVQLVIGPPDAVLVVLSP